MKKIIFGIVIAVIVIGIWFPIIPFPVKNGWHGVGGEWCGIVYDPKCEETSITFLTITQLKDVVKNKMY